MIVLVILVIGIIVMFGIAMIADSNRFHTVSYVVNTDKIKTPFHFVFLSDLHNKTYGKQNQKLLRAIDKLKPEAVLIGGDLLTAKNGVSMDVAIDFLAELMQNYPVYYANGNHEQRLELYPEVYGKMGETYEEALHELGLERLVNETAEISEYPISITGCQIDRQYYKRFHRVNMGKDYLPSILPAHNDNVFQILLAHNPDYFEQYVSYGADLILSGHVHGGVMRLPLLGGVLSTNFTLFPKYDGGRFEKDNSTMIISRGLGAHTIPIRVFNPAELVDITIQPRNH